MRGREKRTQELSAPATIPLCPASGTRRIEKLQVNFNVFEVVLWTALGCEFSRRSVWIERSYRGRCLLAALAFFLFAGSDAVEILTGAWWRPWWLLMWKAACVLVLLLLYLDVRVLRKPKLTEAP